MARGEKGVLAVSRESSADTESSGHGVGSFEALKREFIGCEESTPHLTLKRFRAIVGGLSPFPNEARLGSKPLLLRLNPNERLIRGQTSQRQRERCVGCPSLQVLALLDVVVENETSAHLPSQNQVADCHILNLAGGK